MNQPIPNYNIEPTFSECPQCGMFHPILKPGEKCPNAPITSENGKTVDMNTFIFMLKNIIESQVSKKKIKDPQKMIKQLIIEITKFLEKYEEGN